MTMYSVKTLHYPRAAFRRSSRASTTKMLKLLMLILQIWGFLSA